MTYGISNFLGLLIVGWLIVYVLHQAIGGLLGLFYRGLRKRHYLATVRGHK
jgi:hypothetical protein